MASTLYDSIVERAEAIGEARGRARMAADTIVRILTRRLGTLDPAVATRIRTVGDLDTLDAWLDEALGLPDAEGAARLVDKISKAPLY
jgi:hypothetical protein